MRKHFYEVINSFLPNLKTLYEDGITMICSTDVRGQYVEKGELVDLISGPY